MFLDDIQHDFNDRFNKKAPKHDLLIMWERNAFNSGSVNFEENSHLVSSNSDFSEPGSEAPKLSSVVERNSHSVSDLSSTNGQRSASTSSQTSKRQKQVLPHSPNSVPHFPKNYNPALYKTELCRQYCDSGRCDYGEKCLFAHGKHELKQISNYRTKLCLSWSKGYCQFGSDCMFIHPSDRSYRNHSISSRNGHHRATKMARMSH